MNKAVEKQTMDSGRNKRAESPLVRVQDPLIRKRARARKRKRKRN